MKQLCETDLSQLFVFGFDGKEPLPDLVAFVKRYQPGGTILFTRNLRDPEQIRSLTHGLREASPACPPFFSIDQEGGRVWRLPEPFTRFPEAARLGLQGSESTAAAVARVMARELAAVGVHVNFAPVLDLFTNPENPVIGDRAISSDPQTAARLARAMLQSFRRHGIAGCGKHFPGHGDTDVDSHISLPVVRQSRNRLFRTEMLPYEILLRDSGTPLEMIMTAHVLYPNLDPQRPATLSATILRGILRGALGFRGVVVTDDLEMGAITTTYGPEQAALMALQAGADLLMFCHTPDHIPRCLEAVGHALKKGELRADRIMRSIHRIRRFKARLYQRFPSASQQATLFEQIGSEPHRQIAGRLSLPPACPTGPHR